MRTWIGRANKFCLFLGLLFSRWAFSQESTLLLSDANRDSRRGTGILIVPFENRMYRSDFDQTFCQSTRMSPKQLKHFFRNGLNQTLYNTLQKAGYRVRDLMEDTAQSKSTLYNIYSQTAYDYLNVPDPVHFKPPKNDSRTPKVIKGQLVVESQNEHKFMNARLLQSQLINNLAKQYQCKLFVFINQMDILSGNTNNAYQYQQTMQRFNIHYTLFNDQGIELHSGILQHEQAENGTAAALTDKAFKAISEQLLKRIDFVLFPKKQKK